MRDGNICFYCKMPFVRQVLKWTREFDHLNNNPLDNNIENLVLCHRECNNKKKNNIEWQTLAMEKLDENTRSGDVGVREKIPQVETNTEIDSNMEFNKITYEYLAERLLPQRGKQAVESEIDFKETLDTITFRCYRRHKHSSQNTIRRILDMLCCSEGNFEKVKNNGRWIIQTRKWK